jgi:hypothetical protein
VPARHSDATDDYNDEDCERRTPIASDRKVSYSLHKISDLVAPPRNRAAAMHMVGSIAIAQVCRYSQPAASSGFAEARLHHEMARLGRCCRWRLYSRYVPEAVIGGRQLCATLAGDSLAPGSRGSVPLITNQSVNAISHKVAGCEIVNTVL